MLKVGEHNSKNELSRYEFKIKALLLDSLHYSTKFPPTDYVNTKKSPSTMIEGGQYYMALGGVSVGVDLSTKLAIQSFGLCNIKNIFIRFAILGYRNS
ncbi:hypothetical protein P8452_51177 [Trifolium repens]|nr:hypothetical protein P8452_51177 [Trifolium repens]